MKQVYEFREGGKDLIPLLGGKGGNLAEMTKIGLAIPNGIIVTTDACREYFRNGKKISEELRNFRKIRNHSKEATTCFCSFRSSYFYAWNDGYDFERRI